MTIQPHSADSGQRETLSIPDVTGLDPLHAALEYAKAGVYVLPVKTGKHPGSIVKKDWPELSTRDPDVIESYWERHPQAGIAIHTGKSGLTAFDLDVDVIHDEIGWLQTGLFQRTRRGTTQRGHYVFASAETFVSGDLKLADGTTVGEIRSGNTVIMVEPSPHPKADTEGGEYRWASVGVVPPLPDVARAYVRPLGTTRALVAGTVEAPDELVAQALANWNRSRRRKALAGPVNAIRNHTSGTGTRALTRNALRIAASEARIGFYPLASAVEEIRAAMIESYENRGEPEKFSDAEFSRLVANGVGYAYSRSKREILAEATGDYGTGQRKGSKSRFCYRVQRGRFGYSSRKGSRR